MNPTEEASKSQKATVEAVEDEDDIPAATTKKKKKKPKKKKKSSATTVAVPVIPDSQQLPSTPATPAVPMAPAASPVSPFPQKTATPKYKEEVEQIVQEEREAKSKMPLYKGLENYKLLEKMGEYVVSTT